MIKLVFLSIAILFLAGCGKNRKVEITISSTIQSRGFSYALISSGDVNCDEIIKRLKHGINTKVDFWEFQKLKNNAINGAVEVRYLRAPVEGFFEAKIPSGVNWIVLFSYDKSGDWLFKINRLDNDVSRITIDERDIISVGKFF